MPNPAMLEWAKVIPEIALKWVLVFVFVGLIAMILRLCWKGTIDLSDLLDDPGLGNKASLSRFQLLLSTFVIVGCYLAITLTNPPSGGVLYEIPPGLIVFFGVSGGSYLISKSLSGQPDDAGDGTQQPNTQPTPAGVAPQPNPAPVPAGTAPQPNPAPVPAGVAQQPNPVPVPAGTAQQPNPVPVPAGAAQEAKD